jgi:hypothetical protein
MRKDDQVSPYLKRPLRSLQEVLRERAGRASAPRRVEQAPVADNSNASLPPAKSA